MDAPSFCRWNTGKGAVKLTKPSIKIFVTYKEKHRVLKSKIIEPIQVGRAIASEIFPEMIGDDTDDNISQKNNLFSELSSVYWVWKNYEKVGNPDYIGFMQYRRHFLFDVSHVKLKIRWIGSFYKFKYFTKSIFNSFSDKNIEKVVPNYDYLIPAWHDVRDVNVRTVKEEYLTYIYQSNEDIFDEFIKVCKKMAPEYAEEIKEIEFGHKVLACNLFIFRKELFFRYCEFAFPILFKLYEEINQKHNSINSQRYLGYMAEKLLSMFVMRLEKENKYKEKFLYCSYIALPDEIRYKKVLRNLFSLCEKDNKKHITIFGIKFKIDQKRNNKEK